MLAADLVKDVASDNTAPPPSEGVSIGEFVYFGNTDITGNELWRSDGTVAGTSQVADLFPGVDGSYPSGFMKLGSGFVFDAFDEIGNQDLWYSDGTAPGTVKVHDASFIGAKADADGKLFFVADDYDNGVFDSFLWQAEPDAGGTLVVSQVASLSSVSVGTEFATVGDKLFFTADQGDGMELWVSDGVGGTLGTTQVEDIRTTQSYLGSYSSNPDDFFEANGLLFFTADQEGSGRELWASDGTESGTVLLGDINPSSYAYPEGTFYYGSGPSQQTESGGYVFFRASDGSSDQLWVTDGTADSATKVNDLTNPDSLTDIGGQLFYSATDNAAAANVGNELWSSTASGSGGTIVGTTTLVANVNQGDFDANGYTYPESSYPAGLTEFGGNLIFSADDGVSGEQLWVHDPVADTTAALAVVSPNTQFFGFFEDAFIEAAGQLFFAVEDNFDGTDDIWKTDGTMSGTVLVEDFSLSAPAGYYPKVAAAIGTDTHLFFRPDLTRDWYSTDGTPAAALNLTANFQSASSAPSDITETSLGVFFVANSRAWISDGTEAGTVPLDDGVNGLASVGGRFAEVDIAGQPTVFFVATPSGNDELWKTDGTPSGTELVRQFPDSGFNIDEITAFGSSVLFPAYEQSTGSELWISDGTTSGTMIVSDLNTNLVIDSSDTMGSYPQDLTVSDGLLYFTADGGGLGRQLYQTDGTTISAVTGLPLGGTIQELVDFNDQLIFDRDNTLWRADAGVATLLEDFGTNLTASNPRFFTPHQGELAFVVEGDELWSTTSDGSGTVTGVVLLDDLTTDPYYYADAGYLASVGSNLFFAAEDDAADPAEGLELWAFDGTDSAIVRDIQPGAESSYPLGLKEFQGQLIFSANDGTNGRELWTSDGTAAGTVLLSDIHPIAGAGSLADNAFFEFVEFDDQLFFPADNGVVGEEVWKFTFPLLDVDNATVVADEGTTFSATGTLRFADTITSVPAGVVDNGDGTWTWTGSFPDGPATESVTVTVTDSDGLMATASFSVDLQNVVPTATILAPTTVPEGSPIVISVDPASIVDPGADTADLVTVVWFDLVQESFLLTDSTTRTFDDEGTFNAGVVLSDEDDAHDIGLVSVLVTNVAPTVDAGADEMLVPNDEGQFGRTITFFDPGADIWTGNVDYGDGTSEPISFGAGQSIVLDHVYEAEGSFTVSITVDDGDGGTGTDSLAVEVDLNTPPTASGNTVTTLEDTSYVFTAADFGFSDVPEPFDDFETLSLTTIPSVGTLFLDTNDNGMFDGGGEVLSAGDLVDVADIDADRLVFAPDLNDNGDAYAGFGFEVDDGFEFSTTGNSITIDVTPVNDPPVVDSDLASVTVDEGATASMTGTFSDVDVSDTVGLSASVGSVVESAPGVWTWTLTTTDGPTESQTVTISADDGTVTTDTTFALVVDNVAPTVEAGTDEMLVPADAGVFSRIVSFNDPGADIWTGTVDYGDGTSEPIVLGAGQTVDLNHTYTVEGSFTVSVTVNDDDGGSGSDSLTVDVDLNTPPTTSSGTVVATEDENYVFTISDFNFSDAEPGDSLQSVTLATVPSAGTFFLDVDDDGEFDFGVESLAEDTTVSAADITAGRLIFLPDPDENGILYANFQFALSDGKEFSDIATLGINVAPVNDPPQITADSPAVTVDEGQTATQNGLFFDPDTPETVNLTASVGSVVESAPGVWAWSFTTTDGPTESQTVTITADDGTTTTDTTFALVVDNVAPTVELGADETLVPADSGVFSRVVSFTDPGDDTWTGDVDYGDGTSEPIVLGAGQTVILNHTYATEGTFTVSLSIDDGDLGTASDSLVVTVVLPENEVVSLGPIKSGVAVQDNATGSGFLLHSQSNVFTRFAANPPHPSNADNLVAARYNGKNWQYNNNSVWVDFVPDATDRLIASVDFDAGTITSLQGASGKVNNIDRGFATGDVSFFANQWNGNANAGEFDVEGTFFEVAPQPPLESLSVAPIKSGIGVQDNATGTGFLMYSSESVFSRFAGAPPHPSNGDHLIAVRYAGFAWQYSDNTVWIDFDPVASDVLLASVDFDVDSVTSLEGRAGEIAGVRQGYESGDLTFFANQWNGSPNGGEFDVEGTVFEVDPVSPVETVGVGNIKSGVAVQDNAVGTGFMMHSRVNVFTRFAASPPHPSNSENLIAVRYFGTSWQYNNNSTWIDFVPLTTDRLVASIDFTARTITGLVGESGTVDGISQGYLASDLTFIANQWNGAANTAEYDIEGTSFDVDPVPPTEFVSVGDIKSGIAVQDNAVGTGYLLHSRENLFTRFSANAPHPSNANHLIAVRHTGTTWQYNDNGTWNDFVPDSTDQLLATIDYDAGAIVSLQGTTGEVEGIRQGYLNGDLEFFGDQWNGVANGGEYDVEGTFFEVEEQAEVGLLLLNSASLDSEGLEATAEWADQVDAVFAQ